MVNEEKKKRQGKELERKGEREEHLGSSGDWRRFPAVGVSQLLCRPSLCQRENHGNDFVAPQGWSWIHMPCNDSVASYCLNI